VTVAPAEPRPRWTSFLADLGGGLGLFVLASLALNRLVTPGTLGASLALYAVSFACFAGSAYFLGVRRPGLSLEAFGLRLPPGRWLLLAGALAVAFMPLRLAAALAAELLAGGNLSGLDPRLALVAPQGALGLNFLAALLGAGVLVPIGEELYFRGLLHGWLRARFGAGVGVLASSVLFGLGHADNAGVMASSFLLGLLCAIVLERNRSLWLTIAIHAANNSLAVVLVYVALALQRSLGGS